MNVDAVEKPQQKPSQPAAASEPSNAESTDSVAAQERDHAPPSQTPLLTSLAEEGQTLSQVSVEQTESSAAPPFPITGTSSSLSTSPAPEGVEVTREAAAPPCPPPPPPSSGTGRGSPFVGTPERPTPVTPATTPPPARSTRSSPGGIGNSPAKLSSVTRLSDVQLKLEQIEEGLQGNTLMSRYLLANSLHTTDVSGSRVDVSVQQEEPHRRDAIMRAALHEQAARLRFPNKQVFRRKIVLLGHQEVGKTSLRKCFESEPFFFKRLPEVRTTTGVEVQEKAMSVEGDRVELVLSDFAGQEAYHSHTYFLTDRSIFGLVWKISAVEQDFQSSGISSKEEERLTSWIAEVYAKFPRSRIVLIATHLDELRVQGQRSVEMILSKVEGKLRTFIERVAGKQLPRQQMIVGNFAVSCKTRQILAAGDLRRLSGQKISALLRYLAQLAREDCFADREYPAAALPGRHAKLVEDVVQVKQQYPEKLLMPIGELVHMAARVGVESDAELLQVARLMHSWDIIYLLNPHRVEDNLFVMLHPRWLSRMAAALFSYAHILRTPLHLRSFIGGLEYTVSHAEAVDMHLMRKGYLRWPLARVLFSRPLSDFLKRPIDDSDISMCLELLRAMQILYPVHVSCDDMDVLLDETPVEPEVGRPVIQGKFVQRYFLPSLSPYAIPPVLKRLAPVLFHRGLRMTMVFNLLPDELWWRLQSKLHPYLQVITVHQPCSAMPDEAREEEELLDDYRLKEADDEHSRWKDAMWLMGPSCRVLVTRESLTQVMVFTAENASHGSEAVVQALENAVGELLREYSGVERTTLVACPDQECAGWLDAKEVATSVSVVCRTCGKRFSSEAVVRVKGLDHPAPPFPENLLTAAGELFSFCLSEESSAHLCRYLGVPYFGSNGQSEHDVASEADSPAPPETHVEFLHALDKIVQAALFRSWMERVEEITRRNRMIELEPSPMIF